MTHAFIKLSIRFGTALAGTVILAGVSNQFAPAQSIADPAKQMQADADFVHKASAGGIAEVKLGQLAQEKGSNPLVSQR